MQDKEEPTHKACTGCNEILPIKKFHKKSKNTRQAKCIECRKIIKKIGKMDYNHETEKVCTGCATIKSLDEFGANKTRCKPCASEYEIKRVQAKKQVVAMQVASKHEDTDVTVSVDRYILKNASASYKKQKIIDKKTKIDVYKIFKKLNVSKRDVDIWAAEVGGMDKALELLLAPNDKEQELLNDALELISHRVQANTITTKEILELLRIFKPPQQQQTPVQTNTIINIQGYLDKHKVIDG